MYNLKTAILTV